MRFPLHIAYFAILLSLLTSACSEEKANPFVYFEPCESFKKTDELTGCHESVVFLTLFAQTLHNKNLAIGKGEIQTQGLRWCMERLSTKSALFESCSKTVSFVADKFSGVNTFAGGTIQPKQSDIDAVYTQVDHLLRPHFEKAEKLWNAQTQVAEFERLSKDLLSANKELVSMETKQVEAIHLYQDALRIRGSSAIKKLEREALKLGKGDILSIRDGLEKEIEEKNAEQSAIETEASKLQNDFIFLRAKIRSAITKAAREKL